MIRELILGSGKGIGIDSKGVEPSELDSTIHELCGLKQHNFTCHTEITSYNKMGKIMPTLSYMQSCKK